MKFRVRAVSMNLNSRQLLSHRTEEIDTETNEVFHSCNAHNSMDVKAYFVEKIYEAYWNIPAAEECVKVIDVERVK